MSQKVEIKIGPLGFVGTTVKISEQEVYVSRISVEADGPGIPKVELSFGRETGAISVTSMAR